MDHTTWTCTLDECRTSGGGFPPEECPTCTWPTRISGAAGFMAAMGVHQALVRRAEEVTKLLGHGSEHLTFDDLREDGSFEVEWTTYCGRGCCGPETHRAYIPNRYLWISDEEIQAERLAENAAALRAKEEKERADEIRRAEEAVARAQASASSLASAEARLAALKAGGA